MYTLTNGIGFRDPGQKSVIMLSYRGDHELMKQDALGELLDRRKARVLDTPRNVQKPAQTGLRRSYASEDSFGTVQCKSGPGRFNRNRAARFNRLQEALEEGDALLLHRRADQQHPTPHFDKQRGRARLALDGLRTFADALFLC
jgi:hypothetical protein